MSRLSHPQFHHPNSISVNTTRYKAPHPAVFSIPLSLLSPQNKASGHSTTISSLPTPVHLNCISFASPSCTNDGQFGQAFQNKMRISIAIYRLGLRVPGATDVKTNLV